MLKESKIFNVKKKKESLWSDVDPKCALKQFSQAEILP